MTISYALLAFTVHRPDYGSRGLWFTTTAGSPCLRLTICPVMPWFGGLRINLLWQGVHEIHSIRVQDKKANIHHGLLWNIHQDDQSYKHLKLKIIQHISAHWRINDETPTTNALAHGALGCVLLDDWPPIQRIYYSCEIIHTVLP